MSHSPSASISNTSESVSKKRKAAPSMAQSSSVDPQAQQSPSHIPKRGARACTSCRKGKNRCEGDVSPFVPIGPNVPFHSLRPASPVPGPAFSLTTGSLSSLPSERYTLCVRKAREEECPRHDWCGYRVCFSLSSLPYIRFDSMSPRRLARLEGQYLVCCSPPYFVLLSYPDTLFNVRRLCRAR